MPPLPIKRDSAYDAQQMADYLAAARIPLRLACNGGNGFPLVASHWFEYRDGAFYLAIHQNSRVASLLDQNPLFGFEIAADTIPFRGVLGQGTVFLSLPGDPAQTHSLILSYLDTQ